MEWHEITSSMSQIEIYWNLLDFHTRYESRIQSNILVCEYNQTENVVDAQKLTVLRMDRIEFVEYAVQLIDIYLQCVWVRASITSWMRSGCWLGLFNFRITILIYKGIGFQKSFAMLMDFSCIFWVASACTCWHLSQ